MLKFFTKMLCKNLLVTDHPDLFYKLYKCSMGITSIVWFRKVIVYTISFILGVVSFIWLRPRFICLIFWDIAIIFYFLRKKELHDAARAEVTEVNPPAYYKTLKILNFFRRIIIPHGKGIGKDGWNRIKQKNFDFYYQALLLENDYYHSYFTLEIAKIIKDCTLIWGAVRNPIASDHSYTAKAIIIKDGFVYDNNLWISVPYDDYSILHKLMIFKEWNYEAFSQPSFPIDIKRDFREWCVRNDVFDYETF